METHYLPENDVFHNDLKNMNWVYIMVSALVTNVAFFNILIAIITDIYDSIMIT